MTGELKIGVLLPQSKQYTTLDRDFIRGIRLNNLNAKLYIENIGIGSDTKLIIEKMQKVSLQEEITVFIGHFGHHNINQVYEYASDNGIILIASDMGASVPHGKLKYDGVYINSFALTESAHFLGHYFSNNNYKKIGSTSSYYDAGYNFLEAIESSFSNDTVFSGHYITPLQPRENEAEIMETTINAYEPEAVFGIFSGLYAEENTTFVLKNKITQKYPFFMMPFSINTQFKEEFRNNPHDIYVITTWVENKTQECRNFTAAYQAIHDNHPSAFSLLGYESGLIIKSVLETSANSNSSSYKKNIEQLNVSGPRGIICFNKETNRSCFDHYIYKMNVDTDGNVIAEVTETFKNDGNFIRSMIAEQKLAGTGGWYNAYLCH